MVGDFGIVRNRTVTKNMPKFSSCKFAVCASHRNTHLKSTNQVNPIFIISVLTKISLLVGYTIPNKSNAVRVRCHWTPTMSSYKLCIFKTQDGFEPFRQTTKIFLYPFMHLLRVSLIARDETRTHNIILYVMEKNFCCKCLNARHIFLLCALPIELP